MHPDDNQVPTRAAVEARWTALIEGRATRDEVHAWAAPWVEFDLFVGQPLVETALQYLHGFDFTRDPGHPNLLIHGGDGEFVHSDTDIANGLSHWKRSCAEHDADPVAFRARRLAEARRWIAENG